MGTPAIAMAMMGIGQGLEFSSILQEGKEAAKAGKYQQLMYERQAKAVEAEGLQEQKLLREHGRRVKSRQIVNIAAGGGLLSGTSLKAIVNSAANIESDAAVIAQNTQFEAETLRYHGRVARYHGQMSRYGSRLRAALSLGKNIGNMAMASRGNWYTGSSGGTVGSARSTPVATTVRSRLNQLGVIGRGRA